MLFSASTMCDINRAEHGGSEINFNHRSVLLDECIEGLDIKPDGVYVDGTAGGGGHSYHIAERLTTGRLIAIDQDETAIAAATKRLEPFSDRVTVVRTGTKHRQKTS